MVTFIRRSNVFVNPNGAACLFLQTADGGCGCGGCDGFRLGFSNAFLLEGRRRNRPSEGWNRNSSYTAFIGKHINFANWHGRKLTIEEDRPSWDPHPIQVCNVI